LFLRRVSPYCSSTRKTPVLAIPAFAALLIVCFLTIFTSGCGSINAGPTAANSKTIAPQIQVAISPASSTLNAGAKLQFTAIVQGTGNTAVTWLASAGSIGNDGSFVAPAVGDETQIVVTATSVADTTQHASGQVTVQPGPHLAISTSSLNKGKVNQPYSASLSAAGGAPPYQWMISSGSLPPGITLEATTGTVAGTPTKAGNFSFATKVIDSTSNSATQSIAMAVASGSSNNNNATFDGPAELPRVHLKSKLSDTPAPGSTISVSATGDLQSALDSANCGDTIELQAGATFDGGHVTFPAKSCDDGHWIIVRTSAPDASLPPEGTRMTPCFAGIASLPGRPKFSCTSMMKLLATISYTGTGDGPIVFADGANHYRLLGLEITRDTANGKSVTALVAPDVGSAMSKIVLDRLYIHGTAKDETRRGVALSGATSISVQDSYLSDLHCNSPGTCVDSQAVSGGIGDLASGPYKITNNFLEAAGENILFGGGKATQTPTDIEVTRNHLFKPLIWMAGHSGFLVNAIVKNHFELKNAQRVLFDSNILENDWGGFSQYGASILITPKNQDIADNSVCSACQVTDVTIRNVTISHVAGAFVIGNVMTPAGGVPQAGKRYSIHDVIVDDLDGDTYGGHGTFAEVTTVAEPLLSSLQINHVTAFPNHTMFNIGGPNTVQMPGFVFQNSIVGAGEAPVWSTGNGGSSNCAYYDVPVKTINLCFSGYVFFHNAILGSPYPASSWPSGNIFQSTVTMGFVNFNDGKGGDYHLLPSSPGFGAATDGSNLGANIDAVLAAINGVQ